MAELESSYIIIDYDMINAWSGKFHALATWAGQDEEKYDNIYYVEDKGSLKPWRFLLNSDYYRSLVVRLYNFDGKAANGSNPIVIAYKETDIDGTRYKVVTDAKQYATYQEAQDYIASQKSGNFDIVGNNPFVSPIPLEAVTGYKLVHSSMYVITYAENAMVPEIKIFERLQ
jgi:hypothetical protein